MNYDSCNVMSAKGWVQKSQRISDISGSKVTDSRSTFMGHIVIFCFVHATFLSRDM